MQLLPLPVAERPGSGQTEAGRLCRTPTSRQHTALFVCGEKRKGEVGRRGGREGGEGEGGRRGGRERGREGGMKEGREGRRIVKEEWNEGEGSKGGGRRRDMKTKENNWVC